MAMLIVAGLCLLFLVWLIGKPYYVDYRRRQLRNLPVPSEWLTILRRRVPYYRFLPPELQKQLCGHMQVFIAEKNFVGCAGLEISDEIRVTIAAQACLLILNRKTDYYPKLERILVYPGAFVVRKQEIDDAGVLSEYHDALSGESWGDGQVVLSWEDTVDDARFFGDGRNVVIHEFAHQLDQEKGVATGAPILARAEHYQPWSEALGAEYAHLRQQADTELDSLFDYYGAENPAEFFAVITEVFFEQPQEMAHRHPELYRQLKIFYRVDPLGWR
jgi:hypothetical protein